MQTPTHHLLRRVHVHCQPVHQLLCHATSQYICPSSTSWVSEHQALPHLTIQQCRESHHWCASQRISKRPACFWSLNRSEEFRSCSFHTQMAHRTCRFACPTSLALGSSELIQLLSQLMKLCWLLSVCWLLSAALLSAALLLMAAKQC